VASLTTYLVRRWRGRAYSADKPRSLRSIHGGVLVARRELERQGGFPAPELSAPPSARQSAPVVPPDPPGDSA
jgi:hypothetical protein